MRESVENPHTGSAEKQAEPGEQVDLQALVGAWWRIGVAVVIAAQSMAYSLAVNVAPPDGNAYWVVHTLLIFAALMVCWLLLPRLVGEAWGACKQRRVSVEALFLVTLGGALIASLMGTFSSGPVFYEVISILLAVYSIGKTLGARSRAQALKVVEATREQFEFATTLSDERVAVRSLAVGEVVRVNPGEAISVDGVIRGGRSFVRETAMTGEWQPVVRAEGGRVFAGTYAIDGRLEIEVTAAAGKRRIDGVLAVVADACVAPSRLQVQADKIAARFLPLVLVISVGAFAFWTWREDWVGGVFVAMSVLLVACPCALGLATPLAIWQGLARLAGMGVVARSGDALDALGRADVFCFDKTGTLSADALLVKGWAFESEWAGRADWVRGVVAAVEQGLAHPVARALADFPPAEAAVVRCVCVEAGRGVRAEVAAPDGNFLEMRIGVYPWVVGEQSCEKDEERGKEIAVAIGGRLVARVVLEEQWRLGVEAVFSELQQLGVRCEVLSGDAALRSDGRWRDVRVEAGLMPEEKVRRVDALKQSGRTVVFVGDGINDAAAMRTADAAVAMGGGAALATASATVVFMGSDLQTLAAAVKLAREVRTRIEGNLRFAVVYNCVGMAVAAAGYLHPIFAAVLMAVSSFVVSARALRVGKRA